MWFAASRRYISVGVLLALSTQACGSSSSTGAWLMPRLAVAEKTEGRPSQRSVTARDPRQTAVPGDLPEMGMTDGDRWWRDDEVEAYQEAVSRDVGILVDFSAVWCMPCTALDREALADPRVRGEIDADFVPLKIDVSEETRANKEQLLRYRVYRLPAVIMLDARGQELGRIDHYMDVKAVRGRIAEAREALARRRKSAGPRSAPPARP
jgi:thioredoxin-related protein